MSTITFPNSLLKKIIPRLPDATASEVLYFAVLDAEKAAENLKSLIESRFPDNEQVASTIIAGRLALGPVIGSIGERITKLREIRDYCNLVSAQIEDGTFEVGND